MPKTAAQTKSQLENATENPKSKALRQVVNVSLIYEGVEIKPVEIYEALDAKYGTVTTEKDSLNRGTFIFKIAP